MEIILVTTSKLITIIFKKSIILLVTYSWNKNYNKDKFYVICIVNLTMIIWQQCYEWCICYDAVFVII